MNRNRFAIFFAFVLIIGSQGELAKKALTSGYSNQWITFSYLDGHVDQTSQQNFDENLTWVIFDETLSQMYAGHEVSSYENFTNTAVISRWKVSEDEEGNAVFEKLQVVDSIGVGTCHLVADRILNYLLISNYGAGSFTAYKIDFETGDILTETAFNKFFGEGSNVVPDRQADSHPHGAFVFKNFVYVTDLGCDKIWHFKVVDGVIEEAEPHFTDTPPGSGPRHMTINSEKKLAYVLYELKSLVEIYSLDEVSGELTLFKSVNLLEGSPIPSAVWNHPFQNAAEVETHPNGQWMYFSTRINGAIVAFQIEDDGGLFLKQFVFTSGSVPRHFKISPDGHYLIVANQDGNDLEVFAIDQSTGRLVKTQNVASENSPTIIVFF